MITYTNQLDIYPGNPPIVIKLSQYDTDFSLVFDLFASRGTFTIASGTTAAFREKKPDGNVISVDATLDIQNKRVTVAPSDSIAKQITAIAGKCACELTLLKNGDELNTANFVLLIEKAPVDVDAIESDSVVRELYDVADRADEILDAAERVTEAIDPTLTLADHAADAKATGDRIRVMEPMLLTPDIKTTLLNCFQSVAWATRQGAAFIEALRSALYANEYPMIRAVYTEGLVPIYTDDTLDSIKQYLTVTYYQNAQDQGTVIQASDYTLSGVLQEGNSTLVVTYGDHSTIVTIPVIDLYNINQFVYPGPYIYRAEVSAGWKPNGDYGQEPAFTGAGNPPSRWSFYPKHGRVGQPTVINRTTSERSEYYPIPCPDDAVRVVASIEPSNYYMAIRKYTYDESLVKPYASSGETGWTLGPTVTVEFDQEATQTKHRYISINTRTNSGQAGDPPTSITVTFE